MDGHRPVAPVGRRDQAQLALALGLGERLLLVARRAARVRGQDPDLEEVDELVGRGVELAVRDARAGGHPLHVARPDHRAGAHAVLVLERALEHVGDDLHVAVRVGAEALPGRDAVLVDHAQRAEAHVRGVVVVGERERVERAQPAVVGMAALAGATDRELHRAEM